MLDGPTRSRLAPVRTCTCFTLRKATRAVTQLYDESLRPVNLRSTQFSLLGLLAHTGTMRITALADAAVMDRTTLTRNLDLLERDGLVRIRPGEDARVREVTLTPAGRDRLLAALPMWEKAQKELTEKLGAARSHRFLADLTAAIAATHPG
jgi:DNA-binding MarR family transcriptional regulator